MHYVLKTLNCWCANVGKELLTMVRTVASQITEPHACVSIKSYKNKLQGEQVTQLRTHFQQLKHVVNSYVNIHSKQGLNLKSSSKTNVCLLESILSFRNFRE